MSMTVNDINNFIVYFKLTSGRIIMVAAPYTHDCIWSMKLS